MSLPHLSPAHLPALQELGQQLVDLLKFDDASVRETGAALFADLFAQEPAYYQKFPQLFDPFAAVFRDVEKEFLLP